MPKWRRIAETIADDIRSGRIAVGDRIPAARDLGPAHDADMNTAREATGWLCELGVLQTIRGSGTYVAAMPPEELPERVRIPPVERKLGGRLDDVERRLSQLEAWRDRIEGGGG
jgi:DNA-binding GntR family transcriptional regulator